MSCRQAQASISFTSRNRVTAKTVDINRIIIQADFLRNLLMDVMNTLTVLKTDPATDARRYTSSCETKLIFQMGYCLQVTFKLH